MSFKSPGKGRKRKQRSGECAHKRGFDLATSHTLTHSDDMREWQHYKIMNDPVKNVVLSLAMATQYNLLLLSRSCTAD